MGAFGIALRLNWLELEEAVEEDAQIGLDVADRVLVALVPAGCRASAPWPVVPGAPGEEGDLGRRIAEAQRVVEVEVLQLVRADHGLRLLPGLRSIGVAGDQLRADLGVEDLEQDCARLERRGCSVWATQRIRYWIRVFGTLALTS